MDKYSTESYSIEPAEVEVHFGWPKEVAKIHVANAMTISITDNMGWTPPTPEQIKNLKELLCIEVEIL